MSPTIEWNRIFLFGAAVLAYIVVELVRQHRQKRRNKRKREGFQRMKSSAQHARDRTRRNIHETHR